MPLYPIHDDTELSIGYIDDYYLFEQPKLNLDFNVHHSYLFVGKSYQERENLIQLLLYRIHERNQQVFIIDDLFCKNANENNMIHTDEIENVQELFRSLENRIGAYLLITDLTIFLQNEYYKELLIKLLETNQKYDIHLLIINQSVVNIPYRILMLISSKISLSNDNVQEIQALFSTTEKCIQKKPGYGLIMLHQQLLECSFFQMGVSNES